jgi:hypothetical protein
MEVADFMVSLPGVNYSGEDQRLLDYEIFELASEAGYALSRGKKSDHLDIYSVKFMGVDSGEAVITNRVNDSYGMIEENAREGLDPAEYLGVVQGAEFNLSNILENVDDEAVTVTGLDVVGSNQNAYLLEDNLTWHGRLIKGDSHLLELEASVLTDRGTEYVDVEARINDSWEDALSAFDAEPYLGRL